MSKDVIGAALETRNFVHCGAQKEAITNQPLMAYLETIIKLSQICTRGDQTFISFQVKISQVQSWSHGRNPATWGRFQTIEWTGIEDKPIFKGVLRHCEQTRLESGQNFRISYYPKPTWIIQLMEQLPNLSFIAIQLHRRRLELDIFRRTCGFQRSFKNELALLVKKRGWFETRATFEINPISNDRLRNHTNSNGWFQRSYNLTRTRRLESRWKLSTCRSWQGRSTKVGLRLFKLLNDTGFVPNCCKRPSASSKLSTLPAALPRCSTETGSNSFQAVMVEAICLTTFHWIRLRGVCKTTSSGQQLGRLKCSQFKVATHMLIALWKDNCNESELAEPFIAPG